MKILYLIQVKELLCQFLDFFIFFSGSKVHTIPDRDIINNGIFVTFHNVN
jgi:hypothetical protein